MDQTTTISITEARTKIFDISDQVQFPGVYYTLTEKGRPRAVIMSADEFASWQETLIVSRTFPDLLKEAKQARKEYAKGDFIDLEGLLAKQGYIIKEPMDKKYDVSRRRAKKSAKRNRRIDD